MRNEVQYQWFFSGLANLTSRRLIHFRSMIAS